MPDPIPDLNDPNVRMSRDDAMAAMRARRRETAAADMDPADRKAFLESPPPAPPTDADPDANHDDAAADAARRQIEAAGVVPPTDPATPPTTEVDPAAQIERQRGEELILSDEDLGRYKVRVKINGKEEVLPLTDLRVRAQKVGAADDYLVQAKNLLTEVKDTIRQQPAAPAPAAAPPEPVATDPGAVDEFVDAMFAGDDAKAKAALKKAWAAQPATPTNEAQLASEVERRIVVRSALRQFAHDNPEIMADQMARRVADTFLLEETGGRPIEQIEPERVQECLDNAARRTMEWWGKPKAQARATTRDEKRAMKATIDELPAAATRSSSTVPPPRTASDVIADMKARRAPQSSPPA